MTIGDGTGSVPASASAIHAAVVDGIGAAGSEGSGAMPSDSASAHNVTTPPAMCSSRG